jgi:hypothetical protein
MSDWRISIHLYPVLIEFSSEKFYEIALGSISLMAAIPFSGMCGPARVGENACNGNKRAHRLKSVGSGQFGRLRLRSYFNSTFQ